VLRVLRAYVQVNKTKSKRIKNQKKKHIIFFDFIKKKDNKKIKDNKKDLNTINNKNIKRINYLFVNNVSYRKKNKEKYTVECKK
jgi:hypothetical protein